MRNLPEELFREIQKTICRPEGTFTFNYESSDLFDKSKLGGVIIEIPSGQHVFRLERDNHCCIHFYHSSPGTGTRVATIDLNELQPASTVFMAFSWSPTEIKLHMQPKASGSQLTSSTGVLSEKQFRVGTDGSVFQLGDANVDVMGVSLFQDGNPVILPTAKEAWEETTKAINILSTGESKEGYIYEVVVANLTLAILVTGYEAYSKKRFLELEQEGLIADTCALIQAFYPKKEKEAGIAEVIDSEAKEAGISVLQHIVSRGIINFQNYNVCKRAFNKAYGIKFGELGLAGDTLKDLQSYIRYRHKIVHVSPSLALLNQERVPSEDPFFSNKQVAGQAEQCFSQFIEALHSATLLLRPKKEPEQSI